MPCVRFLFGACIGFETYGCFGIRTFCRRFPCRAQCRRLFHRSQSVTILHNKPVQPQRFLPSSKLFIQADVHLLLLAVLGPLVMKWTGLPLVETGFYMLCPYCLTAVLCLVILRRRRHGENLYLCAGAAAAVSLLFGLADRFTVLTRTISSAADHAGLSLLLLALMVWEYRKYLVNMEEYAWN